jgi:DNA-binding NtrC family response regulator
MVQKILIGESAEQQILNKLSEVASSDAAVLISGPEGLGKELYARHIHQHSSRSKAAFVPVNFGTLPADVLEDELFGRMRGAITGGRPPGEGLVAAADGGTLYFDQIDSLTLTWQVKLLRFLQEKEYRRLGERHIRRANVRIIAATNSELLSSVRSGRFCADLFNCFVHIHFRSMSVNYRQRQLVFLVRYE